VADAAIPPGGTEVIDPPWDPWRPADIARLLAGVTAPWCVAGGWAIDLFLGRQTREHGDLEIAVPASAFPVIRDALATMSSTSSAPASAGRWTAPLSR
jgi:hypothetical protein